MITTFATSKNHAPKKILIPRRLTSHWNIQQCCMQHHSWYVTLQHQETKNATSKIAICNTEAPNIYLLVFLLRLPPRFCYTSPSDRAPVAPPVGPPLARSGALHGAAGGSSPDPAAPLHEAAGGGRRHRAARGEAEDNAGRAG